MNESEVLAASPEQLSEMARCIFLGPEDTSFMPHLDRNQLAEVEERVMSNDQDRWIYLDDGLWCADFNDDERPYARDEDTEPIARLRLCMLLVARGLAKFQIEATNPPDAPAVEEIAAKVDDA